MGTLYENWPPLRERDLDKEYSEILFGHWTWSTNIFWIPSHRRPHWMFAALSCICGWTKNRRAGIEFTRYSKFFFLVLIIREVLTLLVILHVNKALMRNQHPANRTHNPQLHIRPATWKNHSTKYHTQQPLYNTLELLMMGIVMPETCWASNKICNKNLCCI